MIGVIGEIFPLAVGLALSPFPLIAIILLALSHHGRGPGVAFLCGRILTAAAILLVSVTLSDALEKSEQTEPFVAVARILVGMALLWLAVRKWGKRPGPEETATLPKWMTGLDDMGSAKSFVASIVLLVANPKELLLLVGAGLTIGAAELPRGEASLVVAIYLLIACATVAAPVVLAIFGGDAARTRLNGFRVWLVQNNALVMSLVLIVLGAVLIGGGLGELAEVLGS